MFAFSQTSYLSYCCWLQCLEWEPGVQPKQAHISAFLWRGSRKQGNSSDLRTKQCRWSGSDVWMHSESLFSWKDRWNCWYPSLKYSLILCCLRGICNPPEGAGGTEHLDPPQTWELLLLSIQSSPFPALASLILVNHRDSFHSVSAGLVQGLTVIPVQGIVDKNGLLRLNTTLLHHLLILHWGFCQISGVRRFVSISEVFPVKMCKRTEVERFKEKKKYCLGRDAPGHSPLQNSCGVLSAFDLKQDQKFS